MRFSHTTSNPSTRGRASVSKLGAENMGRSGPDGKWGVMHKVFFDLGTTSPDNECKDVVLRQQRPSNDGDGRMLRWAWPFVDIFIDGLEKGSMGMQPLTAAELPMVYRDVEGVRIPVPGRGMRSYEGFAAAGDLLTWCRDQSWNHKYQQNQRLIGPADGC